MRDLLKTKEIFPEYTYMPPESSETEPSTIENNPPVAEETVAKTEPVPEQPKMTSSGRVLRKSSYLKDCVTY